MTVGETLEVPQAAALLVLLALERLFRYRDQNIARGDLGRPP